jgi:hypothetical protein
VRVDVQGVTFLIIFMIVSTSIWVYVDAQQREWSQSSFANRPWKWLLGSLLLWILVFPLYLTQRGRTRAKA